MRRRSASAAATIRARDARSSSSRLASCVVSATFSIAVDAWATSVVSSSRLPSS
jgi:hypothetical protein